ncbi:MULTISPECIES: LysR family transcriptional regulator [Paraburkholderia]|jgi:DNA-binding transcriptional LysR family regulator|uniref:LysR family transcriptional regulator n=1 Tax=Paraburkholderia hospita TaxID=169430 RepID=A0AAJ4VMT0_9BURK|nr:LysR family transcriptional regulator [Paraburkholderia hospita]EUC18447.1 transcriptional regulator, LysR family [Burkholderia sp. BT03]SOE83592.1 transcriptional regulator, LysR family [Burkholderia sp. YR290]AUT73896.1 LysR family transcriptional regulator [Paraburkholderia hospita]EIM99719.1 LysR family transcriptional regulator [Paraburkholderia hospita]OUL69040.1 LysR family transcriptional regulator [Paraburkholderia hospita]
MPNLRKKLPSANALFVFEAAARCGNFTRAAQELYVSQPAVSRMLARMEDHIGVRLFERVRGGIELTESGRILYRAISEGFNGVENAIREIEARATGVESVTLSVSTGFTTHWLMPRMSRLNQAFPNIDLRFQLISGRIGGPLHDVDLGMRFLHDGEIDEHAVLVMPETLLPVCNERYRETALSDAGRAHGDTVIVMDDEERGWHERFGAFVGHGRHVAGMLSFNDYAIVVQAALLGQGIALGWLNVVSHWLAQGALLPAEQEVIVTNRRCCLVRPANKPLRPIVDDVRDWLIEETRNDMRIIEKKYPGLGLRDAMKQTGLKFG